MKRRKTRSTPRQIMRLWDRGDADKAVPYLRSLVGSLRENWLEMLSLKRRFALAADKKSGATRQQLLNAEKQADDLQRAQTRFDDALNELTQIDVFLLEPVRGLALIPFRQIDDLAWYVYDLFAKSGLIGWRLHNDPMEACRPLSSLDQPALAS